MSDLELSYEHIEVGDKARLITGGPQMIVKEINNSNALCFWMSEYGEYFEKEIKLEYLQSLDAWTRNMYKTLGGH